MANPEQTANETLVELLGRFRMRGMELEVDNANCVVPFVGGLLARLNIAAGLVIPRKPNARKVLRGLQGLRNILRLALVDGDLPLPRNCHPDLRAVAPVVAAFPAPHPYQNFHLLFYCEHAAELLAFLTILEQGGNKAAFDALVATFKALPRNTLRNYFGATVTRAGCILMFPKPHTVTGCDYGVIICISDPLPKGKRRTLNKAVLMSCYNFLHPKGYTLPPPDSTDGYKTRNKREREDDDEAQPDPKRRAPAEQVAGPHEAPVPMEPGPEGALWLHAPAEAHSTVVYPWDGDLTAVAAGGFEGPAAVEPVSSQEDAVPELDELPDVLVADLEHESPINDPMRDEDFYDVVDEWLRTETHETPIVPVRGPGDEKHEKALIETLLECLQRANRATKVAIFGKVDDDRSDCSEYSDADTDDEEEYVCPSSDPGVLRLHLRNANPVSEWRNANQRTIVFNPLETDACATICNASRSRVMRAVGATWSKEGWGRLSLTRRGMLTLKPGETMAMTNTDSSFIISAPEDDKPIRGYFLLFYQWCTGGADQFNPKWHVAAHAYRLLPEATP